VALGVIVVVPKDPLLGLRGVLLHDIFDLVEEDEVGVVPLEYFHVELPLGFGAHVVEVRQGL